MKNIIKTLAISIICITTCSSNEDRGYIPDGDASPYSFGAVVGSLRGDTLDEVSGMVASSRYADHYWVHNDSGDKPRIYLIDHSGKLKATVTLPVTQRDWEDIAYGKGYIYIGEIGDNNAQYTDKSVHRFREPKVDTAKYQEIMIDQVETMHFKFSDRQRDCETMMYDPTTDHLAFVTKRELSALLYTTPFKATAKGEVIEVAPATTLPIAMTTAGDISDDGKRIIVKNYLAIYMWYRTANEPLSALMQTEPLLLNYLPEPQGEAIAWHKSQNKFYTVSEELKSITPAILEYSYLTE